MQLHVAGNEGVRKIEVGIEHICRIRLDCLAYRSEFVFVNMPLYFSGRIAQSVEHSANNAAVQGSSPCMTILLPPLIDSIAITSSCLIPDVAS